MPSLAGDLCIGALCCKYTTCVDTRLVCELKSTDRTSRWCGKKRIGPP